MEKPSFPVNICAFLMFTTVLAGQVSLPSTTISPANEKPVPWVQILKKTVLSIETDCAEKTKKGKSLVEPHLGTGFLLSYEDPNYKGISFTYLVTNRHVATPGAENDKPCEVYGTTVRVNQKAAKTDGAYAENLPLISVAPLKFLGNKVSWFFPADESVDLAVIPVGLNKNIYDFEFIPSSLLLTDKEASEKGVTEGDSILFTGLFVQFTGQIRLEPIVRTGKIAMIPGEPIPTTLHKLGTAYLADTHVFGGNSGSPLFIDFGGLRNGNMIAGYDYRLLGVISGYVKEAANFDLQPVASYAGTVEENSGISMVVPSQQLLDLLGSERLATLRKISFSARNQKK